MIYDNILYCQDSKVFALESWGLDGFPSGQRGQTVNLLQIASVVRIHLHPFVRSSYVTVVDITDIFSRVPYNPAFAGMAE